MNRFKSLSPLWFWTVSWFHAVSEGDYVSTSINRKWLWRIVSHDPIYTKKIDDLNVHFVPVTRYHYLVSNLRLTNTYLPCEQDFTNCNQFCTMWKNNNMWTYFHNEFSPIYQSNSAKPNQTNTKPNQTNTQISLKQPKIKGDSKKRRIL